MTHSKPSIPPSTPPLPAADPAGCEYWVANGERCNAPAVCQRATTGFRYCADHADQVQTTIRKSGRSLHLIPFPK